MKLLAISDTYIPQRFMQDGFAGLADLGVDVTVRPWEHDSLVALQEANLEIENHGPEAITLPDDVVEGVESCVILVVQFAPVSRALIERAESLKVIGVLRGGTENIDIEAATERGIAVLNTPGRNARAVAECTIGMILSEVRNIARSHAALKQGQWRRSFPNSGEIPELYGKTVGLVGYGAVARLVAGYLQAFGSRIIAHDPYVMGETAPAELVDLHTLMRESDVVSIHARLTEETEHMVDKQALELMKPTAVLVNTARSGLVDEKALIELLQAGKIAGAALDVFDEEPLPPEHPMLGLENVTVTPHLAGSTIDAFRNSPRMMAEHLRRLLRGDKPLPLINGVDPLLRAN